MNNKACNERNLSLQGPYINIFKTRNKIDAFKRNNRVQNENIKMFPLLKQFVIDESINQRKILIVITEYLKLLSVNLIIIIRKMKTLVMVIFGLLIPL